MAKISDLLAQERTFSFELFPPRSPEGEVQLEKTLSELVALHPTYISITYGAAGSARERTNRLVHQLLHEGQVTPMAHLTCSAHTRGELTKILSDYAADGLENVLALRGDPPLNSAGEAQPGELTMASQLVELAREIGDFCVAVAMHPQGHPRETDPRIDLSHQAAKLNDADFGITQFFFDVDDYRRLIDNVTSYGVEKPIIPGVMPPTNVSQLDKMAKMSGAAIPRHVHERLEAAADDAEASRKVGVDIATELCAKLLEIGAPGLHFYTMNKSTATREIYQNLGMG